MRIRLLLVGMAFAALVGLFVLAHSSGSAAQNQVTTRAPSAVEALFFEKEVLPILKANCFKCHTGKKVRGGLSLAGRAGLLKGGDTGPAIDAAHPEKSLLLKAINYQGGLEMPPSGKLPAAQIATLTRWIKMGAPWVGGAAEAAAPAPKGLHVTYADRDYWAYRPLKRPSVPRVKDRAWVHNPIDAFILAGVEAKGLTPAAPADRTALIRRVYYDLTGLPPTPEEIDAFVRDESPKAYERRVDRLLQSPHYGEKWARHWLDVVRYAETNGFERDNAKPFAWRYRDYVIDAFNKDLPYDRFIREQLAGDLLDHVTPDALIATGYYRLGQWDDEPADRLLARYDVLDGIVSTTGQAFLGMSIGCARCHDHKKDPIPQKDYYRLLAFFHNITDMNGKNTRRLQSADEQLTQAKLLRERQAREAELVRQIDQMEQRFAAALAEKKGIRVSAAKARDPEPALLPSSRRRGVTWTYTFERQVVGWQHPDFDARDWKTGKGGFGTFGTPGAVVRTVWATPDIYLRRTFQVDTLPQHLALELHHDDDVQIYLNGTLLHRAKGYTVKYHRIQLDPQAIKLLKRGTNLLAVHCRQTTGGQYIDVGLLTGQETPDLATLIRRHGVEVLSATEVRQYFDLVARLDRSRKARPAPTGLEIMCVAQGNPVPTHVLIRGNPGAKGDAVTADFPEVLSDPNVKRKPITAGKARLALADWLTDPRNPLTARVMANRLWQHHFGRGIVPTPNDFGKLGEPPTHPELLDWLASELIAGGWKLKRMHKLILLSNAYRMSSKGNEKALRVDPANALFWRFNLRRLTAEEVRDSMLAVSGRLNLKMGGPSIYPPIAKEVLAGQSVPGAGWKTSPPEEAVRRSVYVHIKRSLQVPILAQFDQADTDSSCPVRFTTTVPTQALGVLNGDFSNEQASLFAQRLRQEAPGSLEDQVRRAIRLTTGRVPSAEEIRGEVAFVRQLQQRNRLGEPEALRFYCLMLLNANEFIYLD